MHFHATVLITILAASLTEAQHLGWGDVGASPAQTTAYLEDVASVLASEESSPSFKAFEKKIKPYVRGVPQKKIFDAFDPTNRAEFSTWLTAPLAYATETPGFVKQMPPKLQSQFLAFAREELEIAASLAKKDLTGNSAAPNVMPGLGWGLGLAAGAVGLAAVML